MTIKLNALFVYNYLLKKLSYYFLIENHTHADVSMLYSEYNRKHEII